MTTTELEAISLQESRDLQAHLVKIESGKKSFIEVGLCLADIRNRRLYRSTHTSFDSFVQEVCGIKKSYAHQIIESAGVANEVSAIADIPSEASARELARVPADKRPEVLALAGEKPTAAAIRKAHKTTLAEASEPTSRPEPEQPAALKGIDVSKLDGAKVSETDRPEFFANDFESICDAVIADGNDKQLAAAILAAEVAIKKMRQEANRRRSQQ